MQVLEPFTGEIAAEHQLVAPGEASIADEHYGSARPDKPRRAPRPRTEAEKQFLALGEVASVFLAGAAAAGVANLPPGALGDDSAIQRDRPDPGGRLFGQATSRTRHQTA